MMTMTAEHEADDLLVVVAVALIDADQRVLVQRRPPGRAMAGWWEFPGGKSEAGDTPEGALIRELREELGIGIEAACLAPAVFARAQAGEGQLLLLLYVCRKWQGVPAPLAADAFQWLRPVQLHAIDMLPADKPLIGLLEALI